MRDTLAGTVVGVDPKLRCDHRWHAPHFAPFLTWPRPSLCRVARVDALPTGRIRYEAHKTLLDPGRADVLRMMWEWGQLQHVLPDLYGRLVQTRARDGGCQQDSVFRLLRETAPGQASGWA